MAASDPGDLVEQLERRETDVLVIGSEGAGARAAVEARNQGARVTVLTKGLFGGSGATVTAVYSCCAAFGHEDPRDNPTVHRRDTIIGGRFLNHQKLVDTFTREAPERIVELERFGAKFEKNGEKFRQGSLPGHSYPRAVYWGFSTGIQFRNGLTQAVRRREIEVREDFLALEILQNDGRVAGLLGYDMKHGHFTLFKTKAIVIAAGGCMELYYPHSDAAKELTGDGLAMALRAGAELADMEFLQFLPAAAVWPPALRGFINVTMLRYKLGARLYNKYGERFMRHIDPVRMERSTRDLVSRGMGIEIVEGRGSPHGGVYQDVSFLPSNMIDDWLADPLMGSSGWHSVHKILERGVDFRKEAIEVAPVAHFLCGGIRINERCETNVPGLFAGGEVTAGVNGANRIEGNALPETQVFGHLAGSSAAAFATGSEFAPPDEGEVLALCRRFWSPITRDRGDSSMEARETLQGLMWQHSGLVRSRSGLQQAVDEIGGLAEDFLERLRITDGSPKMNREWLEAMETRNMLQIGQAISTCALAREETRGTHYRKDFPTEDNSNWLKNSIVRLSEGRLEVSHQRVAFDLIQPNAEDFTTVVGEAVGATLE